MAPERQKIDVEAKWQRESLRNQRNHFCSVLYNFKIVLTLNLKPPEFPSLHENVPNYMSNHNFMLSLKFYADFSWCPVMNSSPPVVS